MIERNVVMDENRQREFYIKPDVQKELMAIAKEKERA